MTTTRKWKPDFTKPNPWEGMPPDYAGRVAKTFIPTPQQPYSPIEKAIQQGKISKELTPILTEPVIPELVKTEPVIPIPPAPTPIATDLIPIPDTDYTLNQDYSLLYKEYQRTGGLLDVTNWITAGTPIRPEYEYGEALSILSEVYAKYPGYQRTDVPTAIAGLQQQFNTNPEGFLEDLSLRTTPENAGRVFGMLGITQEAVLASLPETKQNQRITETIQSVFPEYEIEDLAYLLKNDPDTFLKEIQTYHPGSATREEKQRLLEMMGFEPDYIDRILGVFVTIDGVRQMAWRSENNELYDARGNFVGFYDWSTLDVFNPYKAEGLGGKLKASLLKGIGDVLSGVGGSARWLGYEETGASLSEQGRQLQRYAVPVTTDFSVYDLLDPEFYATKVASTIPFALALIPLAVGGYYGGAALAAVTGLGTIWTVIVSSLTGGILSRSAESVMEAGSQYDDAIARGKSEKEAKEEANEVFRNNMILAGADAWEIAIALAPTPKWVPASLVKSNLVRTVRIGGKMVIVGLSEGGEELYQDMIQRHARGEEWQLDPVSKEVFAIGAVMGVGMGLGGDIISGIVNRSQEVMPPSIKNQFDQKVAEYLQQGFTDEQSQLKALNDICETNTTFMQKVREIIAEVKAEPQRGAITPEAEPRGIPIVITKDMETTLKSPDFGFTDAQIRQMTPEQAWLILKEPAVPTRVTPTPEVTKEPYVYSTGGETPRYWVKDAENQPLHSKSFATKVEADVFLADYNAKVEVAIPKAEAGMPEAKLSQKDLQDLELAVGKENVARVSGRANQIITEEGVSKAEAIESAIKEIPEVPPIPPTPPPQSVTPPPIPVEPQPTGGEITRIITQSTEQVRQDKVGAVTKLFRKIPGIRQILEFEQPGIKMTGETEKVLVAMVAENAARSDVSVWATGTRINLLKQIRQAFGKDSLKGEKTDVKFIGTAEQAKNPITGTLKDIADNPELYELSNEQSGVLAMMEGRNDQLLDYVVSGYNAEIGRFQAKEGGAFLPNVDVSEDVVEYLGSEMRAVSVGRGKPRIWQTARERMAGKTPFTPELDVQKLLEGLDSFKASVAGGQTYRATIGGLTRLEVMEQTHPDLYNRMIGLRKQLQSLQASGKRLGLKLETAVDKFLASPVEDIDLANVREDLDIEITRGKRAGMDVEAIRDEIDNVKTQISELKPAWESANLKPYIFIQEGLFRYFPAEQAKLIRESRLVSNNPALNFIERWRGQSFSGDFSPFTIQGVIGVLADPWGSLKAGMGGIRTAVQTHDWNHSISIEGSADDIANNPYEWSQFASLMGRGLTGTPKEYAAGFLSKIPGFDRFTETTYLTVTRGSFNLWQRNYRNMMKSGIPELEAKVAAANVASQVYPLASATRLGQSPARASFLRAMPTSYSFIRQPASLLAEATNGLGKIMLRQKLTPVESLAVKVVITGAASTLAVSVTSAAISAAAKGGDDDDIKDAIWDAINPDPHNGKFCSIIVGNTRIPLGGPYRAIFRAVYPQEVEGSPIPLPFWGIGMYLRNRITPSIGTQLDLILNKDYSGQQIIKGGFPENILRFLAYEFEGFLPLTAGSGVEAIRQGEKYKENVFQQMIGQFMGVNPVTLDNTYLDRMIRQLGLPDPDAEAKPYSIQKPDLYNTKDLFSDASWTKDLTIKEMEQQGFDLKIISIAETREIKAVVDAIPNKPLTDITVEEILDRKYPEITQAEYVLLVQYHGLDTEGERKQFLEDHPEIAINKRTEWLISHPLENAQLAIWGQADILTKEAYNQFLGLLKTLDIPDSAIPEMTLPPETSIDTHFTYMDMVSEGTHGSWEAQLLIKQDALKAEEGGVQSYADWKGLTLSDTPIASLELKVANRELSEQYDALETDEARAQFRLDNPAWVDDIRKIEAIEKGTDKIPTDNMIVDAWVDRGHTIDQFGVGSSEAKVWLLDHRDVWQWALGNGLLTDAGEGWNENVLRINVQMNELDENSVEYKTLVRKKQGYSEGFTRIDEFVEYYNLPIAGFRQERYLAEHPDFAVEMKALKAIEPPDYIPPVEYDEILENPNKTPEDYLRLAAYDKQVPQGYIENYVSYYSLGKPTNYKETTGTDLWYEDDWFMMENIDFYHDVYVKQFGNERLDFTKVPTREVFNLYLVYVDLSTRGTVRENFRLAHPDLDDWGVIAFGWKPITKQNIEITPYDRAIGVLSAQEEEWDKQLGTIENILAGLK